MTLVPATSHGSEEGRLDVAHIVISTTISTLILIVFGAAAFFVRLQYLQYKSKRNSCDGDAHSSIPLSLELDHVKSN